jgi:hypothetical protein
MRLQIPDAQSQEILHSKFVQDILSYFRTSKFMHLILWEFFVLETINKNISLQTLIAWNQSCDEHYKMFFLFLNIIVYFINFLYFASGGYKYERNLTKQDLFFYTNVRNELILCVKFCHGHLHISSICNLRMGHAVVTRTHLTRGWLWNGTCKAIIKMRTNNL